MERRIGISIIVGSSRVMLSRCGKVLAYSDVTMR